MLEEAFVGFSQLDGAIPIHNATLMYGADDPVGVSIAVNSLAGDLEQITGNRPTTVGISEANLASISLFGSTHQTSVIIAGTVDSKLIEGLAKRGQLDISDLQGKWETFQTTLVRDPFPGVENGLVIAGSDKRVAVGPFSALGASGHIAEVFSYHWWADVPVTTHDEIYALPKTTVHGEPTVKYRGLFINDEAPGLTGWWSKKHDTDHYPLNSEFYRHVFDMMLRLKANYLWPAMWASYTAKPGNSFFTDDPLNQQLADDYGIVVSTSHHEPMQRATNEWDALKSGPWDWTTNKSNVAEFMEQGIRRAGKYESYFTVGMRGSNDHAITADDPLEVLRDVFDTERKIIRKYHGDETTANQLWVVYKEVATYYAAGLTVPDDVTLMFTDDNWGNLQRLPTDHERKRLGGTGLYFHLEYVGVPKSYKWHDSNNLAKVYKDLYHAYQRGADRIWVINVGDIKPMELPFGFIMDLAWDATKIDFSTIPQYLKLFAKREFGGEHADEIGEILLERNHLIGRRKYEAVAPSTYSILNYHESERVLAAWKQLALRTAAIEKKIPSIRKTAFFHLLGYPVESGYVYHSVVLGQARNRQYAFERRNATNLVAQRVLADFEADFDLVHEYNTIANEKWSGIMYQPKYDMALDSDWRAPSRDVLANLSYVQMRQSFDFGFGNLGIYAEGSLSALHQGRICAPIDPSMPTEGLYSPVLPSMDPYGVAVRTVELFHRGDHRIPIQWSLEIPHSWISIKPTSGNLSSKQPQQALDVSIDWPSVPHHFSDTIDIRVTYDTRPFFDLIRLPVQNHTVPEDFHGFPETAGMISIEAPHFQRFSPPLQDGNISFTHIPHLGTRSESGSIALRPYLAARQAGIAAIEPTYVEYDIYLFTPSRNLEVTLYINGALDTDPEMPMAFSLTLDSSTARTHFTRVIPDPPNAGYVPPGWMESVADHVWTRKVNYGAVSQGKHTLRWKANSPEVYLEKIVLDTRGGVRDSYLGPPETTLV